MFTAESLLKAQHELTQALLPARAMRLGLPMRTVNPNLTRPSRLLPAASSRTSP